ncbi:rRNA pseudouridine synthase [Macrococcus hajekii]|uniref:Pseudouridine synthase n=1 Tax=Macrococcus hajekii TaxID=198482 RepID=A0A4R6BLY9_9STAP|nr:pseudouridine synthase [Macrococcus hajekii]TDM02652.1 rRNA pseudouridine synthase [Macrococcus hajekii]GGB02785.1 pseudouridine synthase [Macrococcus hajekii]
MRLDKFLANHGIGTRTEVKQLIKKGAVTVNDDIVKKPEYKVNEASDVIKCNGTTIEYEKELYIILNKPQGVISATEDNLHTTVVDLMPEFSHFNIHPVGRLDKDTEGLLILTTDGQFSHRVLSPSKHVNKTYRAKLDGEVDVEAVNLFKMGITLEDGYRCMPAQLNILSPDNIEVTIQEGKFHQVKRMFQAIGLNVIYLKRMRMGNLDLPADLDTGQYRKMTIEEINLVQHV